MSQTTLGRPVTADLYPGPGYRIRKTFARPKPELIEAIAKFPTPLILDLLNRMYGIAPGIRLLTNTTDVLRGPACTVRVYPGDNLMVHKALEVASRGDVLVIDAGGFDRGAVSGEIVAYKAKHRGIAGFIVDGLVRDIEGMRRAGLPIFARGACAIGPLHRGPGELNFDIQCGGVVVHPGDIIIGDINGVVVIPLAYGERILMRLTERGQRDRTYMQSVEKGQIQTGWVDEVLDATHCEVEE